MFDACDVRHTPDAPQRSLTLPGTPDDVDRLGSRRCRPKFWKGRPGSALRASPLKIFDRPPAPGPALVCLPQPVGSFDPGERQVQEGLHDRSRRDDESCWPKSGGNEARQRRWRVDLATKFDCELCKHCKACMRRVVSMFRAGAL
jgi:hypothetical protein